MPSILGDAGSLPLDPVEEEAPVFPPWRPFSRGADFALVDPRTRAGRT